MNDNVHNAKQMLIDFASTFWYLIDCPSNAHLNPYHPYIICVFSMLIAPSTMKP